MKQVIKLLIIVVFIITIGFLLEKAIDIIGIPNYMMNTFEILVELFSVFIAFSIFSITWHAYSESKDNHSLFLGAAFLFVGLLILFHMLSYPFMPIFITPNTSHKAAIFLMESRFILAISFLVSAYIHKDTLSKFINKRVLLSLIIVLSTISLVFILFYNDVMFAGIDSKEGYSPEIILLLSLVTAIILYACYLYTKRSKETEKNNLIYLIYGSVIVVLSNLVYFSYEFSGHFLIITGFFFIYLALYKSSVILPYEKLAIAEEKLRKGVENKYRNLFDNANDAIITTDLKDCVTSWNHSAEKLFGWEGEKVMGKKLSELFLLSQSASGIETVHIHETGIRIFVSVTMSQLLDSNQNLTGLSFIIHDITERKKAEEQIANSLNEKETLLREIHHRVKNNMQIISSLILLQSQNIVDQKYLDIFNDINNRILSMALIHEKLYQSENLAQINIQDYINDLASNLMGSYGRKGNAELEINVENIPLNINFAVPCGLILNELITNSLKYAFPKDRHGKIKIVFQKKDGNMIHFSVSDDGIGIPGDIDIRNTKSLGMHLINALAENQLHGEIILNRERGTEFQINFKGE